jgi:Arc/MetJ family transcription regulator
MRSTVVLRDGLLEEAQALTGLKTKREVLELALQELVRARKTDALIAMLGNTELDLTQEDLARMREDDEPAWPADQGAAPRSAAQGSLRRAR